MDLVIFQVPTNGELLSFSSSSLLQEVKPCLLYTSNTSVPLSIKEALDKVYYPLIEELIAQLKTYATDWACLLYTSLKIMRNLKVE